MLGPGACSYRDSRLPSRSWRGVGAGAAWGRGTAGGGGVEKLGTGTGAEL